MGEFLQSSFGWLVLTFGANATAWIFTQIRNASVRLKNDIANDSLRRLTDIVETVVISSGEVFTRSLVEVMKDGNLTKSEFQLVLNQTYEFAWSLMRNADKQVLAGGIGEISKQQFEPILKKRIEAAARERVLEFKALNNLSEVR